MLMARPNTTIGDSPEVCRWGRPSSLPLAPPLIENIRTLLEAVMELQDREMLLRRHFTALLSSTWRMTSRRNGLSNPQNSLFGLRIINASPSFHGQINASGSTSNKVKKLTNLSECGRLVGRALLDVDNTPSDDPNSLTTKKKKKDVLPTSIGIMEVILEIGDVEKADSIDSLPSTVTLSIPDYSDPPLPVPSENEHHLKSCQHIVENRFRTAAPSDESRSRSAVKSPSLLGKHKLPATEGNKSSRSKLRKTAIEPIESRLFTIEESQLEQAVPSSSNPTFDLLPLLIPQDQMDTELFAENNQLLGLDEEQPSDTDLVPHCYFPDFISGLEDCPLLPEFTDIG